MASNWMKKYKSTGAPRRVVVALRMAGIAGQDKLNGIFNFLLFYDKASVFNIELP